MKVPTAQELMKEYAKGKTGAVTFNVIEFAKDYARKHVKAALEIAAEQVERDQEDNEYFQKITVLNCYPETNIK